MTTTLAFGYLSAIEDRFKGKWRCAARADGIAVPGSNFGSKPGLAAVAMGGPERSVAPDIEGWRIQLWTDVAADRNPMASA